MRRCTRPFVPDRAMLGRPDTGRSARAVVRGIPVAGVTVDMAGPDADTDMAMADTAVDMAMADMAADGGMEAAGTANRTF